MRCAFYWRFLLLYVSMYMQNATSVLSLLVPIAIRTTNIEAETFVPDTIQVTCFTSHCTVAFTYENGTFTTIQNLEYYNHRHSHEFTNLRSNLCEYVYAHVNSHTSIWQ